MRYSATNPSPLTTPIPLTKHANFGATNNDGSQPDGTNARLHAALRRPEKINAPRGNEFIRDVM